MVVKDYQITVTGGVGSVAFSIPIRYKALCVSPRPANAVWDIHLLDDNGFGVGGFPSNSGAVTFQETPLKEVPILNNGGSIVIANATQDGVYDVRIYTEQLPVIVARH